MAKVQMHSVRTNLVDSAASAEDLLTQLDDIRPKLAVLFASRDRDQVALNRALRNRLPKETCLYRQIGGPD